MNIQFCLLNFTGSPIKAEEMPCRFNHDLSDPRTQKKRDNGRCHSHTSNIVTNYCASSSLDLCIKHHVPTAIIKLAVLADDYLSLPFTKLWIQLIIRHNNLKFIFIGLMFSKNG